MAQSYPTQTQPTPSHPRGIAAGNTPWALAARWAGIIIVLGLLAALLAAPMASAQGGSADVFTIAGVEVDATADTAAAARDRALAEGQKAALGRLFDRIVLAADRNKLPEFNAGAIAELVRDFEVSREKRSSVRYLAVLRVRFKAHGIRAMLRGHDIAFAETRSKPVLVLPVFEVAGAFSLWGDPNPWRDAWLALPPSDGLVPLVRPAGGIRNAVLIGAEQAVRGADDRLAAIARHYAAADVLVAVAGFRMGSAGGEGQAAQAFLQVTLSRMGSALTEQTRLESFALRAGESRAAAIRRAVSLIASQIQEEWKRDNRLRFGVGKELTVIVPLTSLADWLAIKRRLAAVAFIQRSDLVYLSRKLARLRINYIGDEEQLALALVQNDIILERGPVSWTLRRIREAPVGAEPGRPEGGGEETGGGRAAAPNPSLGGPP